MCLLLIKLLLLEQERLKKYNQYLLHINKVPVTCIRQVLKTMYFFNDAEG